MKVGVLGLYVSMDKKTFGFKGNIINKIYITYKAEGDGF